MKIGIYLEGSPEMGGGFFQSLKSSLLLLDIEKYKSKIELIITHSKTKEYLQKKKIHNKLFGLTKVYNYLSQLFEIDYSRELLRKIKINHPFYNFIKTPSPFLYQCSFFIHPVGCNLETLNSWPAPPRLACNVRR